MGPAHDTGARPTLGTLAVDGGALPFLDCVAHGAAGGAPRGAVVVLHDASGSNAHYDDVARRFAELGYRALVPHLYHRSGDPTLSYADVDGMITHMRLLDEHDLLADLGALVDHLHGAGYGDASIALVGFCMGGTIAVLGASRLALGAAVTFYGGGIVTPEFSMPPLLSLAPELKTPWLGLYGDLDRLAPVAEVEQLRSAATGSGVATALERYAEAGHAFLSDWRPGQYHEPSAHDAWRRTLEWLDEHLAMPTPAA